MACCRRSSPGNTASVLAAGILGLFLPLQFGRTCSQSAPLQVLPHDLGRYLSLCILWLATLLHPLSSCTPT